MFNEVSKHICFLKIIAENTSRNSRHTVHYTLYRTTNYTST